MRSVLTSHGMDATFFVNTNTVGASFSMSWQQLHDLASDGNEIGGHTLDHFDLTTLSAADATAQVCDDRQALIAHGFAPVSFAYPYGAFNSAVEQIVQGCGYSSARGVGGLWNSCGSCAYAETIPPEDPYITRSVGGPVSTTPLSEIESYVTQAEQHGGGWVQISFHQICDGCEEYATSLATVTAFLDWLQPRSASGTIVRTVQQALGSQPPPPPSDLTPPLTTVACNGGACSAGAYTTPVTVTLTATDTGGSGLAATRYTTNGSDPTTSSTLYTTPLTISQTTTLKYRSWDANNNAETTKTQTITLTTPPPSDLTPPLTTVACNGGACSAGAYTTPVTVTLTATDTGGSGLAATRYTTNGSDPTTSSTLYTTPLTISQTTTLKYRSWDANNNAETTKTQTITLTTPPPTGTTVEKAQGKPASSSSNEASPWAIPEAANDGNTNSRWSSDFLANQWWQVDLGSTTALTSVDITFCDWAWPATYTVSVSTNGTSWTVVANETLTSSGSKRKVSTFAQTNARYVRITGLTRGTIFGTSIIEAQIYGPSGTTPPPSDLTPPLTTVACNGGACSAGAYTTPVTVTLTATDTGGSGLAATRYTTNGSDPTTSSTLYTTPLTISQTTTLKYRSWDANNNAETTKTQTITLTTPPPSDLTPPLTTVACNGGACSAGAYTTPVTVTLTATDTGGSGLAATRYTTNGSDPTTSSTLYTTPLTISQTTTLKYRSWDANNNAETTKTQTITLTTPPPTGTTVEKAQGKPASSSSNEASPWAIPEAANDGNTNSRWSSDFLANQWWQVDLGSTTALTSVDITFCDWAWPATYTVSVSTNGTSWTVVANETLTSSGSKRKVSTFAQTNARYVRITGLTRGTIFGTSIIEAQIYGPSGT